MIPDAREWIAAAFLAFFSPLYDEAWLQLFLLFALVAFLIYWLKYRKLQRGIQ